MSSILARRRRSHPRAHPVAQAAGAWTASQAVARLSARATTLALALAVTLVVTPPAASPARGATAPVHTGLEALESKVRDFTLPNGLKFIVVERHDAPVFSFETMVNSGSANDQVGTTGLAHMMEHMAFKGTAKVGTTNYDAEKPLLEATDDAWEAYLAERRKGAHADSTRLAQLNRAFHAAQETAHKYVVSNGYTRLLEQNGEQGINAYTSEDVTAYFYSLPSNKLELWALLEGNRMARPVFREFYKEREVVHEERRMNYESTPEGRLQLEFINAAFTAHPYGFGGIGFPSDLEAFSRRQGEEFYRRNYVARNMAVAVVGDVALEDVDRYARKYWSAVSDAPAPSPLDTVEPEQHAERRVILEEESQPQIFIGWHIPAVTDPAYPAYQALGDLLAGGDFSRLYKILVKQKKIAVAVDVDTEFPEKKYPHLLVLSVVPAAGQDPVAVEQEVYRALEEIERSKPFTAREVGDFKVRSRSNLISGAEGNSSLAASLVQAQTLFGDWHQYFRGLERLSALTPADVMSAMKRSLVRSNRTVGMIVNPTRAESALNTAGGSRP